MRDNDFFFSTLSGHISQSSQMKSHDYFNGGLPSKITTQWGVEQRTEGYLTIP
jgi:hypothetical protein